MTLGERILKYRKKAGISQEELADRLNVTRQSISLWETDQTLPTLDNLIALADIFDISMDEICGRQTVSNAADESNVTESTVDDVPDAQSQKKAKIYKTLLTVMFALSIASLVISLAIAFILLQTTAFPQYAVLMTQFMWIAFLFLPIPIASLVLRIIFTRKKYKCKKNVIAGCLVIAALIVCGSFTPLYKNNIGLARDKELFIDTINDMTPAKIRAFDCTAVFSYPKLNEYYGTVMSGMVDLGSKDVYLEALADVHMMPSIEHTPLPKGFLNAYDRWMIRNCREFYIYNVVTKEENIVTSAGGMFVFMAFDGYTGYIKILRI